MRISDLQHRAVAGAVAIACFGAGAQYAVAAPYPERPIKIIVPFTPGGPVDLVARRMGDSLTKQLGQPAVVENRPGANGIVGATACKSAAPDGYTVCMFLSDTVVINPSIYKTISYSAKQFAPISEIVKVDSAVVVSASLPVNSLQDLVEYEKKHKGKLNWGHFGTGSSSHLYMTQVNKATGTQFVDVPYQGGSPTVTALVSGQIDVSLLSYGLVAQYIDTGKLKAIAVLGDKPSPNFKGVPLLKDQGLTFARSAWVGAFAPAGTPESVTRRLNAAIQTALRDEEVRKTLVVQGLLPVGGSPEALANVVNAESQDWASIAQAARVSLD